MNNFLTFRNTDCNNIFFINLTLGAQGRPLGKLTLSVGGLRGGGGGGGWMMTSRSRGSTSPSIPLSVSSGSSSSSRASSFLKGSRSLYVSKLSCLTRGWETEGRGGERGQICTYCATKELAARPNFLRHNKFQFSLQNQEVIENPPYKLYL